MKPMISGRSWRAQEFGDPESVLRLEEVTWEPPAPDRLLVRVAACGVGLPDLLMVQGRYPLTPTPPVQPGQEVVGEVVAAGADTQFRVGDRVMGLTPFPEGHGGFGDHAYVRASKTVIAPSNLSDAEAAGFMIGFRTAHAALITRIPVQPGQTVAVLGASGSSGLAASALAKALGARVIAVGSSDEKLAYCASAGADASVNYRTDDVGESLLDLTDGVGVDVLFDPVGGDVARQALKGVRDRGSVAVIGFASGSWIDAGVGDLVIRNLSLVGVFAGGFSAAEDATINQTLVRLAEQGRLRPALGRSVDFGEVPSALQDLGSDAPPGKVTVRLNGG
jgi:NADPH2:quinone reductase